MTPRTQWKQITQHDIPRRRAALAVTSDRRKQVIAATVAFLARTGLSKMELARRIGYGHSTLNKFLRDRYEQVGADDSQISTALLKFMASCPVDVGPDGPEQLYEIGNVREMRSVLGRAVERAHVFMVHGHPGYGKTTVVRYLIAEHNRLHAAEEGAARMFYIYCLRGITPFSLLRLIASTCGAAAGNDSRLTVSNILYSLRGSRAVLIFDEAQQLDVDCFETIRALFDLGAVSLVFTGSHELESTFRRFEGSLEQLERRTTDKIAMPPVTREEASGIVRTELQEIFGDVDDALVAQLLEDSTVAVRAQGKRQSYISIGRLMDALRVVRESVEDEPRKAEVTQ